MPYFKVHLAVSDLAAAQAAATLLEELASPAADAVTLFAAPPNGYAVAGYYSSEPPCNELSATLSRLDPHIGPLRLEILPDANWVAVSQAALPPVRAGRIIIHGSHDRARFAMRRLAIEIDAGTAFGTGHSGTTAGCLAALDHLALRHPDTWEVLDLGCGSGVLAIAAARLFPAARIVASDNDPVATGVARANIQLNRVASRVQVVTTAGLGHRLLRRGNFDLILANILPGPLLALASSIRRALRPGAIAILSGILKDQAPGLRAAYVAQGFRLLRQREVEEWAVLVLQRIG